MLIIFNNQIHSFWLSVVIMLYNGVRKVIAKTCVRCMMLFSMLSVDLNYCVTS